GAEDDDGVVRHLVQLLDEDRTARAQVLDHELVVHHFVTHVDRRAEHFQGPIDDLDGAIDAGAEAAGIGEFDLHAGNLGARWRRWGESTPLPAEADQSGRTSMISTSKLRVLPARGWLKSMVTCCSSKALTTPGNSALAASLKMISSPSDSSMPWNWLRGIICTFCGLGWPKA